MRPQDWICFSLVALGLSPLAAAAPTLNLAEAFADTKADLAGGGTANIMVMGDSLSFRTGTYLTYLRDRLQEKYGNAGPGYQGFSLWSGGGTNAGWTTNQINNDAVPYRSLDGLWQSSSSAPSTTDPTWNIFRPMSQDATLHYVAEPGGGSFEVRDRQFNLITTIDTDSPVREVRTYQQHFSVPPSIETYNWYQPLGDGPVTILGQVNTIDAPGVRVHRAANGGWGLGNFLQRDWTFDEQVKLLELDLIVLAIGANDPGRYNGEQYEQGLHLLVDRLEAAAPQAEIVLMAPYNFGDFLKDRIVDPMERVAMARGLGFLNTYEVAGDYEFWQESGYLDDFIHFSPAGGEYLGDMLFEAFETDGVSFVPEPGMMMPGMVVMFALGQRRRGRAPLR